MIFELKMLQIITPDISHAKIIAQLGAQSFIESHGSSASKPDIEKYVNEKFTVEQFKKELSDPAAIFRLMYSDGKPAAYSKIIPSCANPLLAEKKVCKMERLYVLKDYYDKKLGQPLFDDSVRIAKEMLQKGLWLNVWTGNPRAIRFYEKQGFKIIGETSFKISENHSNPNYWLFLEF